MAGTLWLEPPKERWRLCGSPAGDPTPTPAMSLFQRSKYTILYQLPKRIPVALIH